MVVFTPLTNNFSKYSLKIVQVPFAIIKPQILQALWYCKSPTCLIVVYIHRSHSIKRLTNTLQMTFIQCAFYRCASNSSVKLG